jgi:hypothetical protein
MENMDLMIEEILMGLDSMSVILAAEMANTLKRGGLKMGLAIYKASKYYNVPTRVVSLEVGKLKRHFDKLNDIKESRTNHADIAQPKEQVYWWDNQ